MRISCPHCGFALGTPRGETRIRLVRLPVVVVVYSPQAAIESMCPDCRRDITIPLPLPYDESVVDNPRVVDLS